MKKVIIIFLCFLVNPSFADSVTYLGGASRTVQTRPFIAFFGDSLTFGTGTTHQYGYRRNVILGTNIKYQAIGTASRGLPINLLEFPNGDDNAYTATSGNKTVDVEALMTINLETLMQGHPVGSFVVIYAGTNDCIGGVDNSVSSGNLSDMVDQVVAIDPEISVVIVNIAPLTTGTPAVDDCVPLLNTEIDSMVTGYGKSNLYVSDTYTAITSITGWEDSSNGYTGADGIHPGNNGANLNGDTIAAVINDND